mmetsp:Transcript_39367/g.83229  ORF Transcript_39367/g.83229 Transcript_39367/m.83229 type:complete len:209 (-) Transcript_39367:360-986(-)
MLDTMCGPAASAKPWALAATALWKCSTSSGGSSTARSFSHWVKSSFPSAAKVGSAKKGYSRDTGYVDPASRSVFMDLARFRKQSSFFRWSSAVVKSAVKACEARNACNTTVMLSFPAASKTPRALGTMPTTFFFPAVTLTIAEISPALGAKSTRVPASRSNDDRGSSPNSDPAWAITSATALASLHAVSLLSSCSAGVNNRTLLVDVS